MQLIVTILVGKIDGETSLKDRILYDISDVGRTSNIGMSQTSGLLAGFGGTVYLHLCELS